MSNSDGCYVSRTTDASGGVAGAGDPLISIITPCLNRVRFIGCAIDSVLHQDFDRFEHIVIDGGSTDGTLELLADYPHLTLTCEPDRGVWDAIDKGIRQARGEFVGFLNSDDYYEPGLFNDLVASFADTNIDVVCCGAVTFRDQGSQPVTNIRSFVSQADIGLSFHNIVISNPLINAKFFRRSLFDRLGVFDFRYDITSDRDFLLRVLLSGANVATLNRVGYRYRFHDDSMTFNFHGRQLAAASAEKVCMSRRFLEQYRDDKAVSQAFGYWHGRESAKLLWRRGRGPNGESRTVTIARACRHDPRWPLRVMWWAAKKLLPK